MKICFVKNQQNFQQFLTKKLRLENGVFWDSIPKRCKGVHCVDLGESFPTSYSNEYLLAKFGFDTAENEPCKVCPVKFESSSSREFEFKL